MQTNFFLHTFPRPLFIFLFSPVYYYLNTCSVIFFFLPGMLLFISTGVRDLLGKKKKVERSKNEDKNNKSKSRKVTSEQKLQFSCTD